MSKTDLQLREQFWYCTKFPFNIAFLHTITLIECKGRYLKPILLFMKNILNSQLIIILLCFNNRTKAF
jgi:hypothetical protein